MSKVSRMKKAILRSNTHLLLTGTLLLVDGGWTLE